MKKLIATLVLSSAFYFANAQATRPDEATGSANNPPTYQDKNGKITEVDKGTTGHHAEHKTKSTGTTEAKRKEQNNSSKNKTDGSTTNMDATTPKQ